jgi:hypothetical protein
MRLKKPLYQKAHRACWQDADTFTAHRDLSDHDRIMNFATSSGGARVYGMNHRLMILRDG